MSADFQVGDRFFVGGVVHLLSEVEAARLNEGGRLVALPSRVEVIPGDVDRLVRDAVDRAVEGFTALGGVEDSQISEFFKFFASRLAHDETFGEILDANKLDVEAAQSAGRHIGRLVIDEKMRREMVESALVWAESPVRKEETVDVVVHDGWEVQKVAAPLGVVAFVFEGRPNVCVDAAGVLRSGNSCVFRIGSDALRTARAILEGCLKPALRESGLPESAVVLVDSVERSAGLALFSDQRISLAVARGSGPAVRDLGFVARSSGISVSLHGTGGAWMLLGESFEPTRFASTFGHSLDRKVCNTVNAICVPEAVWSTTVPIILGELKKIGERRKAACVVHVVGASRVDLGAEGESIVVEESQPTDLSTEWEWESAPELFVVRTRSFDEGIDLCNTYSPRFVVSVISNSERDHSEAWRRLDSPFVGDGMTRWVDGQFALDKPELGLSNWQHGRTLARGGILSGDDVRTYRFRMSQSDGSLHR